MKLISVEMMSMVGTLAFSPYLLGRHSHIENGPALGGLF